LSADPKIGTQKEKQNKSDGDGKLENDTIDRDGTMANGVSLHEHNRPPSAFA
jgi:hypothetical protein